MTKRLNISGFTLVELSIVLIIVGFLIAGITAGTSLIHTAKLQNLINTTNNYITSINNFQARFSYLPGDYPFASRNWSTNCTAGNSNTDKSLCDGNGDGLVAGTAGSANATMEGVRGLQHLTLAEMLVGDYGTKTAVTSASESALFTLGLTVLTTPIAGAGYSYMYYAAAFIPAGYNPANYLVLSMDNGVNGQPGGNAISAIDAYSVDLKIDDGNPITGRIVSYHGYDFVSSTNPCTLTASTTTYNTADTTGPICVMMHVLG